MFIVRAHLFTSLRADLQSPSRHNRMSSIYTKLNNADIPMSTIKAVHQMAQPNLSLKVPSCVANLLAVCLPNWQ